ncbi:hypothetical protein C731_0248 [Mycolicibacterium hassiacum DSM 44199]|uniref:Uncharacterized protein n=1 Tax=Mycolicibacterium hassiacum (strain DSM 44199 / CIP 105218 / JCM 12690 / 3849) TaxID=1122247 RepID=K5BDC2_MYCHD|nr:hypothetical protein C731_0248 [Mycolicibacterium hassiacum DSM 44199]
MALPIADAVMALRTDRVSGSGVVCSVVAEVNLVSPSPGVLDGAVAPLVSTHVGRPVTPPGHERRRPAPSGTPAFAAC